MKIKILLLFWVICLSASVSIAQKSRNYDLSKALKIGDTFTPPKRTALMRGDMKKIDWKALADKIVVFDFFDTFCGTCIGSMPHLQELQDKHSDKLQVFNVTWQDKKTLDRFFATNPTVIAHKVNLPVIYADVDLRAWFPYQAAPHIVIVFNGKVQAITFNRLLTEENVLRLHREGRIDLPLKNDFGEALELVTPGTANVDNLKSGAWITGYQNGIPAKPLTFELDSANGTFRSYIHNRSIFRALINTWGQIAPREYVINPKRVIWKVKNPSIYDDLEKEGEAWSSKFAICYERRDFVNRDSTSQAKVVLEDLHSLLGIKSSWETKTMDCWIFRPCSVKPYEGSAIKNVLKFDGSNTLARFIGMIGKFPPVLDEVQYRGNIAVGDFTNKEELNAQLQVYGIEIVEGKGEFEVFVIDENDR